MPTHVHQPPARRLNKNPPTTPDVHHRLPWPLRNILKGCQGNSLGNSSPSCHSCWEKRRRWFYTYVFFMAGCVYVCVKWMVWMTVMQYQRGGVAFWGSEWVNGCCCKSKAAAINRMICLLHIYWGKDLSVYSMWARQEWDERLSLAATHIKATATQTNVDGMRKRESRTQLPWRCIQFSVVAFAPWVLSTFDLTCIINTCSNTHTYLVYAHMYEVNI